MVLTHAHLDHTGYLPLLVRDGFRGPVYCTPATRDLCGVLLRDSGHLQEEEARFAAKHGYSRHHPPLPLYTRADAERSLESLRGTPFGEDVELGEGLRFCFRPAGHMLGAATVTLADGHTTLAFSGDLGRPNDPLLPPPAPLPNTGARSVKIQGQQVTVRAEVAALDNVSAHAGHAEILDWLGRMAGAPREVFAVHGEPVASDALRRRIQDRFGWSCRVPEHREHVLLV